ncbi:hypothetical protein Q0M54_14370, partial [Staphylococcus aureus]|nr:hypothetical protein [Staphylococcus aureus]
ACRPRNCRIATCSARTGSAPGIAAQSGSMPLQLPLRLASSRFSRFFGTPAIHDSYWRIGVFTA